MSIYSPMIYGNGAYVLHQRLSEKLDGYDILPVSPYLAMCPPLLSYYKKNVPIVHTAPDLGPYVLSDYGKNILTFHNFYLDDELLNYASLAQKFYYKTILSFSIMSAIKKAKILTAVSNFTAALVKKYCSFSQELIVIDNGINHHFFNSNNSVKSDKIIKLLFSGNPTKRKGMQFLEQIAEALPSYAEILVTGGLRDIKDKKKISSRLNFIGRVNYMDMPKLYNECDILLFPTFREGMSLVTLEAMSCGLPVVTSNKSSMPELIHHEKGGYLTEFGDVSSMIFYIKKLIENPSLRADMGAYNRERILENYTEERMIKQYRQLFSCYQ